jgi:hypothetical protein
MKEKGSRIVKTILFNEDNEHELEMGLRDIGLRGKKDKRSEKK